MENLNTISRKNTSKYKRKLTSAGDERISSKSIGFCAVSVLISIALVILIIDAPILLTNLRLIRGFMKSRIYHPHKEENKKGN